MSLTPHPHRPHPALVPLLVAAFAAIVFWRTAYPTITWWDSSQYSLAAATLGVTGPPGSLLLTLLGWTATRLPLGSPAHLLNLLAGLLAALAAALVALVAIRSHRVAERIGPETAWTPPAGVLVGASLGALTFAFGETAWEHAIKFTPYVLTAVFTGLILWGMLRWWERADDPEAWRELMWLGVLFGLDFSVHRTNALLLPGLLVWILIRRPRTLRDGRAWLGGAAGMAAGLAVQLAIMPLAASTHSVLNIGEPRTWAGFWDYVSLRMLGGGFLVHLFPRNAPFWSAQVGDLARVLDANFLRWDGPLGPFGILPAIGVLAGIAHLWHRDRRLGIAFAAVALLQAAATVVYFNIPANFFRPLDRHYLPVCVTLAVAMAHGFGAFGDAMARFAASRRRIVALPGGLLLLLTPAAQLGGNWKAHDASRRFFTWDLAANLLRGLPPNAILFTNGDNDTFPLLYLQAVEGVRPDVQVVNRSLANTFWYVDQIVRRDPAFPISLDRDERRALGPRRWTDTTIVVPVEGTAERLGLPAGTAVPDSITLAAAPTAGNIVLPADLVVLDMLRTNRWRRPLCFSVTTGPAGMGWLQPFGRLDGLFWRIVPLRNAPPDLAALRTNLLDTYQYRGYADAGVRIDPVSRIMGHLYSIPFTALIQGERERGAAAECRTVARRYEELLPAARLGGEPAATDAAASCTVPPDPPA